MNCTSSVFLLMGGAAALSFAAMYFYVQNKTQELKKKLDLYNTALTQLQEEKSSLIVKTENMFSENASQNVHLAHLNEENRLLRGNIELLELDNMRQKEEYKKLAELLFEGNS
jgi:predicted nuclease with TOPRIM domain